MPAAGVVVHVEGKTAVVNAFVAAIDAGAECRTHHVDASRARGIERPRRISD
jgi:hypothetical protein